MNRLKDKVIIVTGSTSGIGIGIARIFAAEGAKVVVCGRRAEKGQAVADQIKAEGGEAMYHFMDITQSESTEKLFEDVKKTYGRIDVLVNNAANVGLPDGRVEEVTMEMWDNIFQTDLRGTFWACKCILPYLRENEKGGVIINIGSMASIGGDLGATAYGCAKAGVDILTKLIALQYGKENIRCNCVRPGLIVTPQNEPRIPQVLKDIFMDNILGNRYGCPEDIANMCLYLASDESAYVSGQVLDVDGGLNSHVPTVAQFRKINSRTW